MIAKKEIIRIGLETAKLYSNLSKCHSLKVGCVLMKDTRIISVGYNGDIQGGANCAGESCMKMIDGQKRCGGLTLHAEENALIFAAKNGLEVEGCIAICTHLPCSLCMKRLIQAGIKKIYFQKVYRDIGGLYIVDSLKSDEEKNITAYQIQEFFDHQDPNHLRAEAIAGVLDGNRQYLNPNASLAIKPIRFSRLLREDRKLSIYEDSPYSDWSDLQEKK